MTTTLSWDWCTAGSYATSRRSPVAHLKVNGSLRVGRLAREDFEALCKTGFDLCGMVDMPAPSVFDRCEKCCEMAVRLGLAIP